MKAVGSKEFVPTQKRYFDLAMEEDVCVESSEDRFHFMCTPKNHFVMLKQVQHDEVIFRSALD